jgi:uncharacterized iron-regulated protein
MGKSIFANTCELKVRADMERRVVSGTLTFQSPDEKSATFSVRGLSSLSVNSDSIIEDGKMIVRGSKKFDIDFTLTVSDTKKESVIENDFIALIGNWYPIPDEGCFYTLTADLPANFRAVSESVKTESVSDAGRSHHTFHFPHSLDKITLIASADFVVKSAVQNQTEIFAYFFNKDSELAQTYLDYARGFIERYERLLGPYPYSRFSIVENRLPTGYSFPTYTLLGESVVHLPFIVKTSLGHEILHQWLGNSVFVKYSDGNWCEGLTTYLADYEYAAEAGDARSYRKNLLIDMHEGVRAINEIPLNRFESPSVGDSRPVGYAKSALFFHMLRRLVGDDTFYKSIRIFINKYKYQQASYLDIKKEFVDNIKNDNRQMVFEFFDRWISSTGLSDPRIRNINVEKDGDSFRLEITIDQLVPFLYLLPIRIITTEGVEEVNVRMEQRENSYKFRLSASPLEIVLDPQFEVARKLSNDELPARLSLMFQKRNRFVIGTGIPEGMIATLKREFPKDEFVAANSGKQSASNTNLILLGLEAAFTNMYFGEDLIEGDGRGLNIRLRKHPRFDEAVIGQMIANTPDEFSKAFHRIRHYGKYGRLRFENGRNTLKAMDSVPEGIRYRIAGDDSVDRLNATSINEILPLLRTTRVIFAGEIHDRYSHHMVQVELLRGMLKTGKRFAIGMEMFSKANQSSLDAFTNGDIGEGEFLKRSRYFEEWGFDYRLYRPVIEFAKRNRIRIIALNADRSLVSKVAREGVESLNPQERDTLPNRLDLSNRDYRDFIHEAFKIHGGVDESKFNNFHTAQIVRDETMARTASDFLQNNSDHSIVILAGGGHITGGWGIPNRIRRDTGLSNLIVMLDVPLIKNGADLFLYPQKIDFASTPVLGLILKEGKSGPVVGEVARDSAAEKHGLRIGDTLLSVNGSTLRDPMDLRIVLTLSEKSEIVLIVRRDSAELTIRITSR